MKLGINDEGGKLFVMIIIYITFNKEACLLQ